MNEDVRVTFYSIGKCGYYKWGMKNATFGGVQDTFAQLQQWGTDAELSVTKLMDPAPDDDQLPVYLLGITRSGDDYVFGCWNEVPSGEGAFTSISKNSIVGDPKIHENPLEPNSIPGFPTYFWVVPEKGVVASIKFLGATSGMLGMQDYIKKFMALKTSYAIDGQNEDGQYTVVGYTNQGDKAPMGVQPRFHVGTFRKKGRRAYLLENHTRISKVIRVGRVSVDKMVDKGILQSFIGFVRGDVNRSDHITGVRKAKVELEYTPSEAELIAMMEADDADDEGGRWEDLGFELAGEPTIWINRSRASETFSIELDHPGGRVVSVEAIAKALTKQRTEMLKLLDDA